MAVARTPKDDFEQGERDFHAGKSRGFDEMNSAIRSGYSEGQKRLCDLIAGKGPVGFNQEVFFKQSCKP